MAHVSSSRQFVVDATTPEVLVAALRHWLPALSWSQIRRLLSTRRVAIGGTLCLFENRRLRPMEIVDVYSESLPPPPQASNLSVRYFDRHLVVVEKPARMTTLRHKAERSWPAWRRRLQPSLDEALVELLSEDSRGERVEIFSVHRIDRDTSGLLVFARHRHAQSALIEQFASHSASRVYRALVPGHVEAQTICSHLVRDRGDGLRGSNASCKGRRAVTHIRPLRIVGRPDRESRFTELECRLETGRTHQIRIHMAEQGHPLCGDARYRGPFGALPFADESRVPRLALHAAELGIAHPITGHELQFASPWPDDMTRYLSRLVEI